jgi:hypothetical protein
MTVDLCGWREDNGTGQALNSLTPRAWRQTAFASGVATKVAIKGHSGGQVRYAVYSNNPLDNNRPLIPLGWTEIINTVAGEIQEVELNVPVAIFSGDIYHHDFIQVGSTARLRAGTITSTQRSGGAAVSAITDPFADPFSFTTGTSVTVAPYVMLIADGAGISGIDKLNTGQTSRITFNAEFPATQLTISDGEVTKNISASTVTASSVDVLIPAWVDETEALKIGLVTITATDGTDTTTVFNADLQFWGSHPDNADVVQFTPITITSLGTGHIGAGFLQVGMQALYDATRFALGADGILTTVGLDDYVGVTRFWFRDPDDYISEWLDVDTSEGLTAPTMPADKSVTVYEGATVLTSTAATGGTEPIIYTLGGDDAALFTIDEDTAGPISFVAAAEIGTGVVTVTATNSVDSATQTITFSVIAAPEETNGLTSAGLTSTGFTSRGLTSVGL